MLKQIEKEAQHNDLNKNNGINEGLTNNPPISFVKDFRETYSGKRKQQITALIIINAISSIYQVTYCLLKNYKLTKDHFNNEIFSIYPISDVAMVLYSIYIFSFLLTIVVNYGTFYWVIRNQFSENMKILKQITSLSEDEIRRLSIDESKSHDINKFLHKSIYEKSGSSFMLE